MSIMYWPVAPTYSHPSKFNAHICTSINLYSKYFDEIYVHDIQNEAGCSGQEVTIFGSLGSVAEASLDMQ